MASNDWQYMYDDTGMVRVKGEKVQSWRFDEKKWKDWDYKKFYPAVGSYGWCMDFKTATPEEIKRVAKHYGAEGFTLDG